MARFERARTVTALRNHRLPGTLATILLAATATHGCESSAPLGSDAGAADSGTDAAREDGGAPDAGADPRKCSPCRAMNYDECHADLRCEAVPLWGADLSCYPDYDDRGFSSPVCRILFPGCRARGVIDDCTSPEQFLMTCDTCDWSIASVDALGCRRCAPCSPSVFEVRNFVEPCAVEALCRESPGAAACVDGGVRDAGAGAPDSATDGGADWGIDGALGPDAAAPDASS